LEELLDSIRENLGRLDARSVIDILLIAAFIYWVLLLLRGTTAMAVLRGSAIVLIGAFVIGRALDLRVLNFLLRNSLVGLAIAVPIVFQPELRRALERLGRAGRRAWIGRPSYEALIDALTQAAGNLAERRHGALLVLERGEKAWFFAAATMALCVLGMMLTHYFAIGAAAAMGVWALIRLRGPKLRYAITCLFTAAVVYLIIWGPFLWRQRGYVGATADPWLVERSENHLVLTLDRLAKWPLRFIVDPGEESAIGWLGVVLLVAPPLLAGRDARLQLWMLWLAGTLGLVAGLDLLRGTRQLQFARYVCLAAPAVAGLIAALAARLPRPLHHATPAIVVLIALACWRYAYVSEEPDWRKLGQIIDQHVQPGEAIVFYHGAQAEWFDEILYLGSAHYSQQFPRTIVRLSRPASPQLVQQLPGETAWLVSWQLGTDVSSVLPGARVMQRYEVPNLAICTRVRIR